MIKVGTGVIEKKHPLLSRPLEMIGSLVDSAVLLTVNTIGYESAAIQLL
jgi:hypothetical protein